MQQLQDRSIYLFVYIYTYILIKGYRICAFIFKTNVRTGKLLSKQNF